MGAIGPRPEFSGAGGWAPAAEWNLSDDGVGPWRVINTSTIHDGLQIADFTGNGKADVFRANGKAWYICEGGTGNGKVDVPWRQINTSVVKDGLQLADFTANGKADVFRADGKAWYISEDGTGPWRPINHMSEHSQLHFADFTGNGKADVFRPWG